MYKKAKKKTEITHVEVNGVQVKIRLHPPTYDRSSWFVYWKGGSLRSTGQSDFDEAVKAARKMLLNQGKRKDTVVDAAEALLSNEQFEAIQRDHYGRKKDQDAARKTLESTLDSIGAFKAISGLTHIVAATPADCERFMMEALKKPRHWRQPDKEDDGVLTSPSTVNRYLRELRAAFNRINMNADRKCVYTVNGATIPESKLLKSNPWNKITWVEAREREIRQFDADELLSFLDFIEKRFPGLTIPLLATKTYLWSACRKLEVTGLRWDRLHLHKDEVHFEVKQKASRKRWFRIPTQLYQDLLAHRTDSPYVFGGYTDQLRQFYAGQPQYLKRIGQAYDPRHLGRWIYLKIKEWSDERQCQAYVHIFRKTGLQFMNDGEDQSTKKVANDAGVSEGVMLGSYVDPVLLPKSNRTFNRIIAGLPPKVAIRYGYVEDDRGRLERQINSATTEGNWDLVMKLVARRRQLESESRPHAS